MNTVGCNSYGEVAVGKAAAKSPATVGNHPGVRVPSLSAKFLQMAEIVKYAPMNQSYAEVAKDLRRKRT